MSTTAPSPDLRERVAAARWYHAMELPGGIVTPGDYDMPDTARRIPFPESLAGKRCLDVGTRDGFWAFEMERRGAEEVVGIDLDDPNDLDFPEPRPDLSAETMQSLEERFAAFFIAHEALGSKVERINQSVYGLSKENVGEFDFAFIGTLLLHLRNPVDALAAIRRVLKPDGLFMTNDAISLPLTVFRPKTAAAEVAMESPRPFWYVPNAAGRLRQVEAAGFAVERHGKPYLMHYGAGWQMHGVPWRQPARIAQGLVLKRGAPHTWIIARPHPDAS